MRCTKHTHFHFKGNKALRYRREFTNYLGKNCIRSTIKATFGTLNPLFTV